MAMPPLPRILLSWSLPWFVRVEDEPPLEAEPSCVPCVLEEFAEEDAVRVVTELAAEVFLPEVEAAAPAPVVVADPCT